VAQEVAVHRGPQEVGQVEFRPRGSRAVVTGEVQEIFGQAHEPIGFLRDRRDHLGEFGP